MNFKEFWLKTFHRSECLRVVMYNDMKKVSISIIRNNIRVFTIGEKSYNIDPDKVYYLEGIPTVTYHESNPNPIDPVQSKATQYTSEVFNKIFKQEIIKDIIKTSTDEGTPLKTVIMMATVLILVGIGASTYFLNQTLQKIITFINENQDVIQLIKEFLLSGGN